MNVLLIHLGEDPCDPLVKEAPSCRFTNLARLDGSNKAAVLLQGEEDHKDLKRYRGARGSFQLPKGVFVLEGRVVLLSDT